MPTSRTVFYMSVFLTLASLLAYGCGKSEAMDPGVEKIGRATGPVEAPAAVARGHPYTPRSTPSRTGHKLCRPQRGMLGFV